MDMLTAPIRELPEYEEILKALHKEEPVELTGCVDSQKLHMIYGISADYPLKVIVTYNAIRAKEILEDASLYEKNVVYFPAKDMIFYQADVHSNELTRQRLLCLRKIRECENLTIVTTMDALMAPQVPPEILRDNIIEIGVGDSLDLQKVTTKLISMGYEKNYQVEVPGQFSVRGGILDVFDLTADNPVRIELWGDEIDSIRSFDVESQRSIENLYECEIYPATEMILTRKRLESGLEKLEKEAKETEETLREQMKTEEAHRIAVSFREIKEQMTENVWTRADGYLNLESYIRYFYAEATSFLEMIEKDHSCIFLDEPSRLKEHMDAVWTEFEESMKHRLEKGYILPGQMNLMIPAQQVYYALSGYRLASVSIMDFRGFAIKFKHKYSVDAKTMASYNNSFEALVKDLEKYKKKGYRIILFSSSRTRAQRLAADLAERELNAYYTQEPEREVVDGSVACLSGTLRRGFEYPQLRFVVLSENDIFTAKKQHRKYKKTYEGQKIRDFAELSVGDYVVHESHGLGIYRGIEKIEVDKVIKDYIKIEYGGGGNLYIAATGLDVIQKYASADSAKKPKLNKLGTQEWEKTKSRVRSAVAIVAKDLVDLYAKRQEMQGYVYGPDTEWQKEFEELFPYEETRDQLTAIEAVKEDMQSTKIMDRLICGDVGYGKTEIAIRAAFKAVLEHKQVVFLVPTTILAQQHYNTFKQRMKEFAVEVELLSRFRTPAQQKKTIENLRNGMVDIVIGTHRLLSKDVQFKDLGLLIIDEEQRFGVTHKEKIKKLRNSVDVLTLTATPIPRTLHMSLVGIRDMSVLEEAPNERMPIQTYVMEYNEELVREAIVRELTRNGQVYYVYNRVHNIADITGRLKELIPEANIAYAHGQMKETELESIMLDFINGEIDVLVSTTIIETGLDIPNVNTMIIHDADTLGLSQLYQLRGRVGRSNRSAYAFLMYKRDKMLREIAEKRLQVIREFTELGSGIKIAMRDLEIRGAGNMLGAEQHGHMEAVGYDMYCKMLRDAVGHLKGEKETAEFGTQIDLDVDAYIPSTYILNEKQKLDIYKRIAVIENAEQEDDIRKELEDRFGSIPRSAENLIRISRIREAAHRLYATDVKGSGGQIRVTVLKQAPINPYRIPAFIDSFEGKLKFEPRSVSFVYSYRKPADQKAEEELLLTQTELIMERMKELYESDEE